MRYYVEPGETATLTSNGTFTIVVGDAEHTITLEIAVGAPKASEKKADPPNKGDEFVVGVENIRLGEELG